MAVDAGLQRRLILSQQGIGGDRGNPCDGTGRVEGKSSMSVTAQKLQPAEMARMGQAQPLNTALMRLRKSIEGLEAVLHHHEREHNSAKALEEELQVLMQDRARLADELDHVKAKASKLDAVSAEVAGRLDVVMADIGSVLGGR